MAPQQYIPATGYSTYSAYHPAFGATIKDNESLPTYGADLNGASSYPWGATNNQFNTTGNYSGVYDPVRDNTGAASHYHNPSYDNTSNYANNGNNSSATRIYPKAFQSKVSTQLNNHNDYGTSQSQNQHHYNATFNNENGYGASGPFFNTNQYHTSTQLHNGSSYGAIGAERRAYETTTRTQFNNGNDYGLSSFQSPNPGFSGKFNSGSDQEYEAVNNSFRRLSFQQTPGYGRPRGIQKILKIPGVLKDSLGRNPETMRRVANLVIPEARGSPELRVRSPRNVTQNQKYNINQSLSSPQLGLQSPVWYRDFDNQEVQEPQEVQPAQEEQQQERQAPRLGEPRVHYSTVGFTPINKLTRSFLDGSTTANPNARLDWLRFGYNDDIGPPIVEPNEENFYKKTEMSLRL